MSKKYLTFFWMILLLVVVDQAVKTYVHTQFSLGESISVINGYFNITYVRNTGAAFGMLAESHETFRKIFFLFSTDIQTISFLHKNFASNFFAKECLLRNP